MSLNDIAVSVRGLSKAYTIGHNEERQVTLAEQMLQRLKNPFKRAQTETFWALKDVEFDIKKGDVVGIIGRNGAGKSTLLKILSRITEPTAGEIRLYGRVGSLLEVGTGFHPELTGRENIYLNGQILGMRKKEIEKQFDAIVDFAGVEKFLDTPVKRYSSGMYVRLAFAVAAHLNPEILIIDEVLSVGDAEFQSKCLGKMEDVAQNGRTVLFVSHNMDAVRRLCKSAVLLCDGTIEASGPTTMTTDTYLRNSIARDNIINLSVQGRGRLYLEGAKLLSAELNESPLSPWTVKSGSAISLQFEIEVRQLLQYIDLGIGLFNSAGTEIASVLSSHSMALVPCDPGRYRIILQYIDLVLVPGTYVLGVGIESARGLEDYLPACIRLQVVSSDISSRLKADCFGGSLVVATRTQMINTARTP